MNSPAPETAPLPLEVREGSAPVKDRMTTTLFLAALFHGIVILGVTFAVPMLNKQPTPSIEVLLVPASETRAADNLSAQYLAQRNQQGSGTTDEHVRPANPASSAIPAQQAGIPDGNSSEYREAVSGKQSAEILSSRSEQSEVEYRSGEDQPAQQAEAPLALAPTDAASDRDQRHRRHAAPARQARRRHVRSRAQHTRVEAGAVHRMPGGARSSGWAR